MIRHIVLITIDCLRADHVHAYGYERETTPMLDALAAEGTMWTDAHSTSSWTRPSVTSLLTGRYPSEHGVFQGIKRSKGRGAVTTDVLPDHMPTIAEALCGAGWRCGAFINNAQLGEFTGLNRGFEAYEPTAGKADRLIEQYRRWLTREPSQPSFAYLHFLEAHWPYKPRRRHIAMFGGDRDRNCFRDFSARDFGRLRRDVSRGEAELTKDQMTELVQMYDGAVRRLDGKIKIVLRLLEDMGLRDETAIVVTADHGEEFLDHGHIGHGQSLYRELTHVPLVMSLPDGEKGQAIDTPVSLVDLPSTITSLAGAGGLIPGTDLRTPDENRAVYGELCIRRRYTQFIQQGAARLYRMLKFELPDDNGPRSPSPYQWRLSYPHESAHELYDLTRDPGEWRNLAEESEAQSTCKRLDANIESWWDATAENAACVEAEIDECVVQRLRDLGYVD